MLMILLGLIILIYILINNINVNNGVHWIKQNILFLWNKKKII